MAEQLVTVLKDAILVRQVAGKVGKEDQLPEEEVIVVRQEYVEIIMNAEIEVVAMEEIMVEVVEEEHKELVEGEVGMVEQE
jgi:hypothetical protein